jgi:hypothetical protein
MIIASRISRLLCYTISNIIYHSVTAEFLYWCHMLSYSFAMCSEWYWQFRDCIWFFMFRLLLWKNHSSWKVNCDVGFTLWLEISKRKAFTKMVNSIIQAERQIVMWGLHCGWTYPKERHSPRWKIVNQRCSRRYV